MQIIENTSQILENFSNFLGEILFFNIFGFQFIVLWLVCGALFFTIRLKFLNIRMFFHAIKCVSGKYSKKSDPGEITHFQALSSAVSATVGLGNISGVAVAITLGGPGAVLWMVIAGLFSMSTKFAEVLLGVKYRITNKRNGKIDGGAFFYLRRGLKNKKIGKYSCEKLGKILAISFAFICLGGAVGGGNMFQINQTVSLVSDTFNFEKPAIIFISALLTLMIAFVLIGGIKRIANITRFVVPFMSIIYIIACIAVISANSDKIADSVSLMIREAFGLSQIFGGFMGSMIVGFGRAVFSNEAGLGSAPIAHAASKTKEPVRAGMVALLEPFIDTVLICFATGLVIIVTGVYTDSALTEGAGGDTGIILTSNAFATVIEWFPYVLSFAVTLFAFSTMITWSYYGEKSFAYLFGKSKVWIFRVFFCTCSFVGGIVSANVIIDLSFNLLLLMCIPNLIGLYILSGEIRSDTESYLKKLREGKFKADKK